MKHEVYGKLEDLLPEGFEDIKFDNPQFREAFMDALFSSDPITAIIGPGGCGKSVLLKIIAAHYGEKCLCMAPTGVAAQNISGKAGYTNVKAKTIHSALRLEVLKDDDCYYPEKNNEAIENLVKRDIVLLDEISMVNAEMFDMIMFQITYAGYKKGRPIKLVVFGDPMQLPPVEKNGEPEFFFESQYWKLYKPRVHFLSAVYRQDNEQYKKFLSELRVGKVSDECMAFLKTKQVTSPPENALILNPYVTDIKRGDLIIKGAITCNREAVEAFMKTHPNAEKQTFKPHDVVFKEDFYKALAKEMGSSPNYLVLSMCEVPSEYTLVIGERVMCTRNDPEGTYVNGSIGVVTGFTEKGVKVKLDKPNPNGDTDIVVQNHTYSYSDENCEDYCSVKQIPLVPAYEISYHKAQGITLDSACLKPNTWGPGMLYVGLSRVKSPDGLTIFGDPGKGYKGVSNKGIEFLNKNMDK